MGLKTEKSYSRQLIVHNRIKCRNCGDIIESIDVHDFKWCSCKSVFVDGGHEYLRRGFINSPDDFEEMSETVPLNSHGVNANIKYKILSPTEMKKLGFKLELSDEPDRWYAAYPLKKAQKLDPYSNMTFNITLPLDESKGEADLIVIDEDYLEPYDYQYYIEKCISRNKRPTKAMMAIRDEVEEIMQRLQNAGVLSGHKRGDYI